MLDFQSSLVSYYVEPASTTSVNDVLHLLLTYHVLPTISHDHSETYQKTTGSALSKKTKKNENLEKTMIKLVGKD